MSIIDVVATKKGHCGYLRKPGDEFAVEEKDFNPSWMARLTPAEPTARKAKPDKKGKPEKAANPGGETKSGEDAAGGETPADGAESLA